MNNKICQQGRKGHSTGRMGWIVAALIVMFALFAPVPANADIGATKIGEITDPGDATFYEFLPDTYSNNVLYIAFTTTSCPSTGSPPCYGTTGAPLVTSVSGAGLDFDEIGPVGGVAYSSNNRRIQAWRALATSGATTGVVTVDLNGEMSYSMGAVIIEFTGTKTSGTNGADAVANYKITTGSGASLEVLMDAFADPNNRPVAFFSHRSAAEATDHEPGYTELCDMSHSTNPMMSYEAEWHDTLTGETTPPTPSASWTTSASCGGFALEIANADELAWWNTNYAYRMQITVTNNDSIQLAANTIASFTTNTAALISGGKLRLDGNDWRIVYNNGGTQNEIAHLVEGGWNTASTETWFRLQAAIDPSATATRARAPALPPLPLLNKSLRNRQLDQASKMRPWIMKIPIMVSMVGRRRSRSVREPPATGRSPSSVFT